MTNKELLQLAVDTLDLARNGLQWYNDHCPEFSDGADDEALAEIDETMEILVEQIKIL